MADEFKSYVLEDLAPPWLLRPVGKAFLQAFAELKDEQVARMKEGVKLRFPLEADASALPSLGKDNQIERGAAEGELSFRRRLANAHEIWSKAGTRAGVLAAIAAAGAPEGAEGWTNARAITNREWALFGSPGVPPDGRYDKWARFWLVIGTPLGFTLDGLWQDDGYWGDPDPSPLWGTDDLFDQLDVIPRLLALWAPFHARAMGVWFVDGATTEPDAVPYALWFEGSKTFDGDHAIYWRLG